MFGTENKMIRTYFKKIAILLVVIPLVLFAERKIDVSVDRTVTNLRTPINLTIEFTDFSDFPKFDFDLGNSFKVIGGPSQSSNFSWINGKTTSTKKLIYQIVAKKTGELTIPSFDMKFKGKNYKTNNIIITVTNQTQKTQNRKSNNRNNDRQKINSQVDEKLFVDPICEKSSVYLGESIVITYRLYTKINIIDYNIPKINTISGFMVEKQNLIKNPKVVTETINGIQYKTADLFNLVLTPTEIGKLEIPPQNLRIEVSAQRRSNDPFDSFFSMSRNNVVNTIAPSKNINVIKLPNCAYDTFTGAVGNFNLSAKLSNSEIEANQAVTLKTTISGEGNLKNFTFPKPNFPSQFQVFEPKMKENIEVKNGQVVGNKTWEYVIIPDQKGTYNIPPIKFTYYDLNRRKYRTLTKSNLVLKVKRNEHLVEEHLKNLTRNEVELLNKDIRYLYLNESKLISLNYSPVKDLRNWLLYFVGFFVIIIFFVYRLYWHFILKNPIIVRRQKAFTTAKKELDQITSDPKKAFYKLSAIFNNYIADRLNLKGGEIHLQEIIDNYKNKKVDDEILNKIKSIWKDMEKYKFASNLINKEKLEEMKNEILNLMGKLEKIK